MFPVNFPYTASHSGLIRHPALGGGRTNLPFAAVRRSPCLPQTSSLASSRFGPAPAGMILAQRYGQAAMGATPYFVRQTPSYSYQSSYYTPPAAPVRRYSPFSPVLSITRYASRSTPPPPRPGFERINFNAAAPAVLTDEQSALLCARLELVGNAEATGGLLASQARVRQNAVAAFAEVLNVPENQVDRHVRGTSVVIRDVIAAILTAERRPFPCAVQMVKLIQDFIAAVRRRHPSRVQPANAPRGPGPGPDPGAGGAAALVAIAKTEGGDAQPIHQQSFGTIETPITAENAETHVDTSVGGGQETPSQIPSPVDLFIDVNLTAAGQSATMVQNAGGTPIEHGDTTGGQVATADVTQQATGAAPQGDGDTATTQAAAEEAAVTEEGAAASGEQGAQQSQTPPPSPTLSLSNLFVGPDLTTTKSSETTDTAQQGDGDTATTQATAVEAAVTEKGAAANGEQGAQQSQTPPPSLTLSRSSLFVGPDLTTAESSETTDTAQQGDGTSETSQTATTGSVDEAASVGGGEEGPFQQPTPPSHQVQRSGRVVRPSVPPPPPPQVESQLAVPLPQATTSRMQPSRSSQQRVKSWQKWRMPQRKRRPIAGAEVAAQDASAQIEQQRAATSAAESTEQSAESQTKQETLEALLLNPKAMAASAQTAQQTEAAASSRLAPLGFPEKLILDEGRILTPYVAGNRATQDSLLIKTDPVTHQACLKVIMSTGLLVDATVREVRGNDCVGLWTVTVNGKKITVKIDENGDITFP